jgi:choline dehydrogenase-like flavoprotein
VKVYLDGVDNFDGSTAITGHGYNFYSGEHRKEHAAMMIETWNVPDLRMQRGRWRQIMKLKFIVEDLRQDENVVRVDAQTGKPIADFKEISNYTKRGLDTITNKLSSFLKSLPVEHVEIGKLNSTEAHIIGTTVMGTDPKTSVVDPGLVHHQLRNLLVLGSGAFPTAAPANPTLTLSALSLRAADKLL